MEGHETCETLQHCESLSSKKGIEKNRKRKWECMTEHSSLAWGWGFIGSKAIDPSAEHEDQDFLSGYHSAETEVVTDSDDDLFFLEEVPLTSVQEEDDDGGHVWDEQEVEGWEEEEWWEEEEEEEDDEEKAGSEEEEGEEALDQEVESGAFPPELCVICLTEPRNASFVHGRTGNQVCCFGCTERLQKDKRKCPVCPKKIKLVLKNFF